MAEADVTKQSTGHARKSERRETGLARRGEFSPFFSLSPREFFSMSPFALMRRMSEEMDRFFSGFTPWRGREAGERVWAPDIDVYEREGKMVVCADLPGLSKDDVRVEVTPEGLVIEGERKREQEEEREGFYRAERSYGRFYRTIPLPEGAEVDKARAQFNNGVLEVTIPVPEERSKRRQIQIEAGGGERTRAGGA